MRLFEISEPDENTTVDAVQKFILEYCTPYLKMNPNHKTNPLYRGLNRTFDGARVFDIPIDREPTDTPKLIHNIFDAGFKNTGFKATRTNSIFCSGNYEEANEYGARVFVIYPIGEFSFTWSPDVVDLFRSMSDLLHAGYLKIPDLAEIDDPAEILYKIRYDLRMAYEAKYNKEFHGLKSTKYSEMVKEIQDIFNISFDEAARKFNKCISNSDMKRMAKTGAIENNNIEDFISSNYHDNDLMKAIGSNVEIMISGSKYLAISQSMFSTLKF